MKDGLDPLLASQHRLIGWRAEQDRRSPLDLLGLDLLLPLRHAPAVAEGVDELPVALAPEGVFELVEHLGAGVERALPGGVGVVDCHRQRAIGAAEGLR
jgi:hypothetical protein